MLVYRVRARSMKSRGANVETRANLSVNTISSYAEALVSANPPHHHRHTATATPHHPPTSLPNMFAEVFMLNKVIVSSGPTLPFVSPRLAGTRFKLCHPPPPVPSQTPPPTRAKFEKWK